jgi:hypothetical protein
MRWNRRMANSASGLHTSEGTFGGSSGTVSCLVELLCQACQSGRLLPDVRRDMYRETVQHASKAGFE